MGDDNDLHQGVIQGRGQTVGFWIYFEHRAGENLPVV